jgi:hypothetical protein
MSTKDRADEDTIETTAVDHVSFEGIREVVAPVEPLAGQPARAHGPDALEHIRIACQPGGEFHSGGECRRCARFVNWLPSRDRTHVTVRCLWRESDRVADLMAYVSVLPVVSEETTLSEAVTEAERAGIPYLVVAEDGDFRGLLAIRGLQAGPGETVRDRMMRPTWSVSADASLGDTVSVMKANETDLVPVLADGELLGVVTRAALCEAGLAAAFEHEAEHQ